MRTAFLLSRNLLIIFLLSAVSYLAVRAYTGHPSSVVLTWSTGSELDTAGFNVLRSARRDGPFVKLNRELVPASPDPLRGGEYSWTDSDAAETSYYLLQSVSNAGVIRDLQVIEVSSGSRQVDAGLPIVLSIGLALVILVGWWLLQRRRARSVQP